MLYVVDVVLFDDGLRIERSIRRRKEGRKEGALRDGCDGFF